MKELNPISDLFHNEEKGNSQGKSNKSHQVPQKNFRNERQNTETNPDYFEKIRNV